MHSVGILTFYDTTNYGALFQMYALEKKVKQLSADSRVSIIQYDCKEVDRREKISILQSRSLKEFAKNCILYVPNRIKHDAFEQFAMENIQLSKIKYNKCNLNKLNEEYDAIIVGSDQVWNSTLTGNDLGFYLPGCNGVKKYSYAASFGKNSMPDPARDIISHCLNDFRKVSVREKDGERMVEDLGISCETVLDPTFLLSKEEWMQLADKNRKPSNYILMYLVQDRKNTFEYAKRLAKEKGYSIKYINISPRYEYGVENIRTASPTEFMNLLANAELIITGSYHGVALSINLEKNFICELNHGAVQFNSRIQNLLSELNLDDRIIDYDAKNVGDIDYEKLNIKLDACRKQSLVYLQSVIEDIYEHD